MPARVNTPGDIGTAKIASDSYDVDNIFLTDEGWVYRHYKNDALTKFWDEIIVAGEVDAAATISGVPNAPVDAINDATPTFESGDGKKDVEYSPDFSSGGGGTPPPPPADTIGTITITGADTATDGDTVTYSASNGGTATGVSYSIASSDGSDVVSGMDVTFNGVGARTLTVTGAKSGASDSPATATKSVTVS